jgi:hypothetical protein
MPKEWVSSATEDCRKGRRLWRALPNPSDLRCSDYRSPRPCHVADEKERDGPAALEISSSRDCPAPRIHRRGAESAMRRSGSEVALDVEGVEDGSVSGEKSLRARALEALHLALPASGRLMRILGAIVLPPTALMAGANPKIMGGGGIRAQIVRDQSIGDEPVFL